MRHRQTAAMNPTPVSPGETGGLTVLRSRPARRAVRDKLTPVVLSPSSPAAKSCHSDVLVGPCVHVPQLSSPLRLRVRRDPRPQRHRCAALARQSKPRRRQFLRGLPPDEVRRAALSVDEVEFAVGRRLRALQLGAVLSHPAADRDAAAAATSASRKRSAGSTTSSIRREYRATRRPGALLAHEAVPRPSAADYEQQSVENIEKMAARARRRTSWWP